MKSVIIYVVLVAVGPQPVISLKCYSCYGKFNKGCSTGICVTNETCTAIIALTEVIKGCSSSTKVGCVGVSQGRLCQCNSGDYCNSDELLSTATPWNIGDTILASALAGVTILALALGIRLRIRSRRLHSSLRRQEGENMLNENSLAEAQIETLELRQELSSFHRNPTDSRSSDNEESMVYEDPDLMDIAFEAPDLPLPLPPNEQRRGIGFYDTETNMENGGVYSVSNTYSSVASLMYSSGYRSPYTTDESEYEVTPASFSGLAGGSAYSATGLRREQSPGVFFLQPKSPPIRPNPTQTNHLINQANITDPTAPSRISVHPLDPQQRAWDDNPERTSLSNQTYN